MVTRFVVIEDCIVPESDISEIDLSSIEELLIFVRFNGRCARLENQAALDLLMRVKPSALEGRRFRFARHAWAFHNLVAHPGLQVLSWLGLHKLGFRLHDATIPRPKARR